ncbi:alpha/beta hydrolase [Streptomyces sp. NPDC050625]|uniref:alpha/beta fold hydrolase n=1 Tax=Streptomyces sp. NPDC050625 TaxID=3154629 RepID=UPI0034423867
MFEGFEQGRVPVGDVEISIVTAGSGPPVLLLHGAPQTHVMWHAVAPGLSRDYTVVAADLRGYGDSSKPHGGGDHAAYSFRTSALDQVGLMTALGYERFAVVGHDRGARVSHRLALDHPERVTGVAILDVVPTDHMYRHVTRDLATAYWHWFTLTQPEPLPERLIAGEAGWFLKYALGAFGSAGALFTPEALAEYTRCFEDPAMVHAMCEDYRAAASIDLEHDAATRDRRIECPLLVLWGAHGDVGRFFEPLAVWREYATNVQGGPVEAGHFLVEQQPEATLQHLQAFLATLDGGPV